MAARAPALAEIGGDDGGADSRAAPPAAPSTLPGTLLRPQEGAGAAPSTRLAVNNAAGAGPGELPAPPRPARSCQNARTGNLNVFRVRAGREQGRRSGGHLAGV